MFSRAARQQKVPRAQVYERLITLFYKEFRKTMVRMLYYLVAIINYFILRSSHSSSCGIKHPIIQIMAKQLNISPHILLCAYWLYSFPDKDFQRQFELVMNTTNPLLNTTNPLPTTIISNNLKNQDLMASLQKHLD